MTMHDFRIPPSTGNPTLLLGYAQIPISAIPIAVRSLTDAIRSTR